MAWSPQPLAATLIGAIVVSTAVSSAEEALPVPRPPRSTFRVRLGPKGGGEEVRATLVGARERLEDPRCASIVTEFE